MEDILRMILRYPASGSSLEFLKLFYYQLTEHYCSEDTPRRNIFITFLNTLGCSVWLMAASPYCFFLKANETVVAIMSAMMVDDSRAVEILLAEFSQRILSTKWRFLILNSQLYMSCKSVHERQHSLRIANLLIDRQYQSFSQLKLRRTNGALRVF